MQVFSNSENEMFECYVTFQSLSNDQTVQGDSHEFESSNVRNTKCKKLELHDNFIPFNKMGLNHFEEPFKRQEFVNLTKTLGNLVVKLELNKTSLARPKRFPKNSKYGTGRIRSSKAVRGTQFRHCSCKECELSESPRTEWGEISVVTAAHVVFDQLEAENSICILRYNKENSESIVSLEGLRVVNVNEDHDRSNIIFITHDMELVKILIRNIFLFRTQHKRLYEEYKTFPNNNLAILISHPHGWPKQVSVGTYERNEHDHKESAKVICTDYSYDLHSCPGSSGAPVYFLGKEEMWTMHPHSRSENDGDGVKGRSSIEYEKP